MPVGGFAFSRGSKNVWFVSAGALGALMIAGGVAFATAGGTTTAGAGASPSISATLPAPTVHPGSAPTAQAKSTTTYHQKRGRNWYTVSMRGLAGTPTGTVSMQYQRCLSGKTSVEYVTVRLVSGEARIDTPTGWFNIAGLSYSGDSHYAAGPDAFEAIALGCGAVPTNTN